MYTARVKAGVDSHRECLAVLEAVSDGTEMACGGCGEEALK